MHTDLVVEDHVNLSTSVSYVVHLVHQWHVQRVGQEVLEAGSWKRGTSPIPAPPIIKKGHRPIKVPVLEQLPKD